MSAAEQRSTGPDASSTPCTVAVDLDGVLAQYDKWEGVDRIGDPIPGAIPFVQALLDEGFTVCVHTTRTNPAVNKSEDTGQPHLQGERWAKHLRKLVRQWLSMWGFPAIGERFYVHADPGKPIAVAYVDDRAVSCEPQGIHGRPAYGKALAHCVINRQIAAGPAAMEDVPDLTDAEKDMFRLLGRKVVGLSGDDLLPEAFGALEARQIETLENLTTLAKRCAMLCEAAKEDGTRLTPYIDKIKEAVGRVADACGEMDAARLNELRDAMADARAASTEGVQSDGNEPPVSESPAGPEAAQEAPDDMEGPAAETGDDRPAGRGVLRSDAGGLASDPADGSDGDGASGDQGGRGEGREPADNRET